MYVPTTNCCSLLLSIFCGALHGCSLPACRPFAYSCTQVPPVRPVYDMYVYITSDETLTAVQLSTTVLYVLQIAVASLLCVCWRFVSSFERGERAAVQVPVVFARDRAVRSSDSISVPRSYDQRYCTILIR